MAYKPIRQYPKNEDNPFVEKAINDITIVKKMRVARTGSDNAIQTVINKDGEITGHTQFLQYIEVDEEKFAKVYLSQFSSFWELSKTAIRVFGYILTILKPNQDIFILRMDKCKEHTKYSQDKSIFEGLSNLIECGIIARAKYENEYYINPLIVFNGSRVTFAKTYVKKRQEKDPKQLGIFEPNKTL